MIFRYCDSDLTGMVERERLFLLLLFLLVLLFALLALDDDPLDEPPPPPLPPRSVEELPIALGDRMSFVSCTVLHCTQQSTCIGIATVWVDLLGWLSYYPINQSIYLSI